MGTGVQLDLQELPFCAAIARRGTPETRIASLMNYLSMWLRFKRREGATGAVVFDIDDTLVDEVENKIGPVFRVYRLCKQLGFEVAIVTARPDTPFNRKETVRMLRERGIDDWESLYMMPTRIQPSAVTVSAYKRQARDDISERHDIIANVGDMWHDILRVPFRGDARKVSTLSHHECGVLFPTGSHGEVAIKLIASVNYDDDVEEA